jgi:hypothetical protein
MTGKQSLTHFRVGLDHLVLLFAELVRFVENGVGHTDLAQVMEKPAQSDTRHIRIGEPGISRQDQTVLGDAPII